MTHSSLHSLFDAQAARSPDTEAVWVEGTSLSYAQLGARADNVAHRLRAAGVGPGDLVGLCLPRGFDMAAAVLGTLKAGGAYVPLDPAYPPERLRVMLEDAAPRALLTHTVLTDSLPPCPNTLFLDTFDWQGEISARPDNQTQADHLAYVIYTSGSTGTPKGVALSHGALVNLMEWQVADSPLGAGDKTLQFASLSFDVSCQEMFATWASGGTLVLISEDLRRDPRGLLRLIREQEIARLFLPFVALQQLADALRDSEPAPPSLKEVMTAGEQLQITPKIAAFFAKSQQCTLHNQYGPSETHVVTQYTLTGPPDTWPALPPIGKAIASTQTYILDDQMARVADGEEGELFLGGAGLAQGYLRQPALTQQKFVPAPFDKTQTLYKTGDRARLLPTGDIEFLGRNDGQVKIRGFRIEIGEIEHALAQHPAVRQCAVTVQGTGMDKALCAFVVAEADLDASELRGFLSQRLPSYMVPAQLQTLDALPLTPSGKVDRRALATQSIAPIAPIPLSPTDGLEQQLTLLWQEVLGVNEVGPHDDFFALGGHSLLALRLLVRVEAQFGQRLPLPALFAAPTVVQMAALLRGGAGTVSQSEVVVPLQPLGTKPPLFCIHHIDGNVVCYREMAQLLGRDQPVYGLQAPALTGGTTPFTQVEEMAARFVQEIIAACPEGPVNVCGFSFGGVVALEVAQQLHALGRMVSLLALLDTYAPRAFQEDLIDKSALRRLPGHLHHMKQMGARERMQYLAGRTREGLPWAANTAESLPDATDQGFLPQTMRAIQVASLQAQLDYVPRPYAGRTLLLRATQLSVFENFEPKLWWGETFTQGLEIQDVPGAHLEILRAPHVAALAQSLLAALEHHS